MVCGIRLAEQGRRCAIVSQGQSAIHFSSGSFDLLRALPDGTAVDDPLSGHRRAGACVAPQHPYAVIGRGACRLCRAGAGYCAASPSWATATATTTV